MNSSSEFLAIKNVDVKKVYQLWKGNNKFLFQGRIYAGPNYFYGLITLTYILIYIVNGMIIILLEKDLISYILVIIELLAGTITSILFLLCIFTDPGILYRNNFHMEIYNNCIFDPTSEKHYYLQGRKFKIKVCSTCMIIRPLGSSHCRICNNCIERYDHHCPWVGNCIGKNNYVYFYFFLLFFNILIIISLTISVQRIMNELNIQCIIQIVLSAFTSAFVFSLYLCHIKLTIRNLTTYTNSKLMKTIKIYGNPFRKKSFFKNCKIIFCSKYSKKVDFTKKLHINTSNSFLNCESESKTPKFNKILKLQKQSDKSNKDFINYDIDKNKDNKYEINNIGMINENEKDMKSFYVNNINFENHADIEITHNESINKNIKKTKIHLKINLSNK